MLSTVSPHNFTPGTKQVIHAIITVGTTAIYKLLFCHFPHFHCYIRYFIFQINLSTFGETDFNLLKPILLKIKHEAICKKIY